MLHCALRASISHAILGIHLAETRYGVGTSRSRHAKWTSDIRLLALDMDGTLLDSNSKVLPSSIKAIKARQKFC